MRGGAARRKCGLILPTALLFKRRHQLSFSPAIPHTQSAVAHVQRRHINLDDLHAPALSQQATRHVYKLLSYGVFRKFLDEDSGHDSCLTALPPPPRRVSCSIFGMIDTVAAHINTPLSASARSPFSTPPPITSPPGPVQQPLEFAPAIRCAAHLLKLRHRKVGLEPLSTKQTSLPRHRAASDGMTRVARFC